MPRGSSTEAPGVPGGATTTLSRVVCIGASAGGLEALQDLLGPIPQATGAAYVVAQHLAPEHPSLMVDLLDRSTMLPVVVAEDGALLAPDTIVVGPPNRDILLTGDRIKLIEPDQRFSPSPSIDLLFESLASQWGERAVAVVLTGTGSDGAHGLRTVRAAGGLTLVQSPQSARFDGMPRAAISLGGAELIGTTTELATRLAELSAATIGWAGPIPVEPEPDMLASITSQLRRSVGIDFSRYKESTLRRQVQRRMAVRQAPDLDSYFALLAEEPDEAQALCTNLLVTVTSFFRDPDAYESLHTHLSDYIARGPVKEQLRVWVPGCATGEEVYSIAMVISDVLGHPDDLSNRLKIFGTDLDETSLAIARRGTYPVIAGDHIPSEYRKRFTSETTEGMQIGEVLRECTIFARHDVGEDPPFPRMDLISCRNTLIYFTTPLQDRVLHLYTYALLPDALLFLGRSETLERATAGFDTLDAEHRIFVRNRNVVRRPELIEPGRSGRATRTPVIPARASVLRDTVLEEHTELLEALVRSTSRPCVILDERHHLVEVVGDVSPFCRVPEGQVTTAVGSFLRPELQDEARALFLLSRADGAPVSGQPLRLEEPDLTVRLHVSPLAVGGRMLSTLTFVVEEEAAIPLPTDRTVIFDREIKRLERELLASQATMHRSMSELQAANEELEAASEELQASSEELQAANEELEASNEELQATNEELGTLNQELRVRGEQLERLNTDLENIQASLSQGMVMVDHQKKVTRFTPLAVRVFALVDTDIGRPLAGVPTTVVIGGLDAALDDVLAGEPRVSIECSDGPVSYLVQVLPYQDKEGRRHGAIITLTDVTEMAALRSLAQDALTDLQSKSELLQQQATFDALTGLLNRGRFSDAVNRELARAERAGERLAVVVVDIDRFKEVNDEYGHDAGDGVLRTAATRILECVRATDIVGRLGGDEFAILVSTYDLAAELESVLERIVDVLRQPITLRDWDIKVSGSVGVAVYPDDDTTVDGMMRAADAAMYSAKKAGGDSFVYFDPSLNEASDYRRVMRHRIDDAMAGGDFCLHYQPIVSTRDSAVWGVEALMRWNRDGEVLSAADFIPFCEESGQIRVLGMLALGMLREDIAALRAAGHAGLKASVNFSASQLEDPHLAELLASWPTPGGLEGIVIEVLESVFMPEHGRALELLSQLQRLGAEISIDDYGSGYSNHRLLALLAPPYIKLDRDFLNEHKSPGAREALIRSAVEMSHVFGAQVVAEGIEDDDQRSIVEALGVEYLQGYEIARPMPRKELVDWLTEHAARS